MGFLRVWLSLGVQNLVNVVSVTVARARRGPLRPGWSWRTEVMAGFMRRHFARLQHRSWTDARRTFEALAAFTPLGRGVERRHDTRAGRPALWVTPRGVSPRRTMLFFHGGAYLFGTPKEYVDLVGRLACAGGLRAVSVDYRLAPEHPFPAALDDALAAYRALLAQGVAPEDVVVAGDSAGGGLTAALLVALRGAGDPLPRAALLLGPWVDQAARGGSLVAHEPFDVFTPEMIVGWSEQVLAGADPKDPRASPAWADLSGLPPLFIQVGGVEMLRDQVVAFAERAQAAGVDVTLREWADCFHDWQVYALVLPEGRAAIAEAGRWLAGLG